MCLQCLRTKYIPASNILLVLSLDATNDFWGMLADVLAILNTEKHYKIGFCNQDGAISQSWGTLINRYFIPGALELGHSFHVSIILDSGQTVQSPR